MTRRRSCPHCGRAFRLESGLGLHLRWRARRGYCVPVAQADPAQLRDAAPAQPGAARTSRPQGRLAASPLTPPPSRAHYARRAIPRPPLGPRAGGRHAAPRCPPSISLPPASTARAAAPARPRWRFGRGFRPDHSPPRRQSARPPRLPARRQGEGGQAVTSSIFGWPTFCEHLKTELRAMTCSNGSIQRKYQCLECGLS